jgi:hypothetical protein
MFTEATTHAALNAIIVDKIKLHSGDPGAAGTSNVIAGAEAACAYAAAAGGQRLLTAAVDVPIAYVDTDITVSHFSVWDGITFRAGKKMATNPETFSNSGTARVTAATLTVPDLVVMVTAAITAGYGEVDQPTAITVGLAAVGLA